MITVHKLESVAPRIHVVLLHAFPLSSQMWEQVVRKLSHSAPDCSFYLVDLPGFGTAPVSDTWTVEQAAEAIYNELQKFSLSKVVIGGLSMGGYIAFAYYKAYPDNVQGLILSNTKAEADTQKAAAEREEYAQDVEKRGTVAVMDRQYAKFISKETQEHHQEIADQVKTWIGNDRPAVIAAALRAMAIRPSSEELLSLINVPTLVIVGEKDELISPESAQEMANKIANASVAVIPEAGHFSAVERPEEWATAVADFLKTI